MGTQEVITVSKGGSYFDPSKVLWDEGIDGPLPTIILGGMVRVDSELVYDQSVMDATTAVTQAADATANLNKIRSKIEALWAAADRYTSNYVSGVAIGILTIGVIQGKPKALAVTAWSSSIWTEYYIRKAAVTATSADNHDFSQFGAMPFSVPELQAEIGL